MTRGIIGRKLGMTQVYSQEGDVLPVTVIEAGPCTVVQKKTLGSDGYDALQLGFSQKKKNKINKPLEGHLKKHKAGLYGYLKEFRVEKVDDYQEGEKITVDAFNAGDFVDVTGISKGKGFAGVVKRWGFKGGPGAHGSMFHRAPGSIGASAYPSRVFKGRKMPGRLGGDRVTVQNIKVIEVRPEENLILLKGAVPGFRNGVVIIRSSIKK
ncbi:MAG: 50S ribosomal protein L3 [Deltaproteobacteria bacterium CG12_big_fil_rev_8_21_14_0_65_43_10]|nr:MAG: 50S ribosomal protein L3 [Deltaproteobacteria bacterium CG2_30_43_15]PIQ45310.1 MAG: 50S ribosomal protein L3 [Deltaproteobacteria bacterium CG12_big_fil_rev_8_21_14_0_65_43_10]PIU85348.1 MAG: 50S ribosomal protein L3 [Deltaproteobacteria bacterium CG06_land_8_20_14_3_00_44_19]PIX26198.1 MAG: 50S ribosomal protein L3 [Deltaproteobacteria bacterium CG_4_8_14_3_um_filter_43_13]PIZ20350.1 MAG: 50S ribosomal protein L3 [Deltaproteobacteria bacterium CG_4_10_14_0_8_um_filter_43_12]PJB40333.